MADQYRVVQVAKAVYDPTVTVLTNSLVIAVSLFIYFNYVHKVA